MHEGYGVGDPLVYWALRILLFGALIYCGWGIAKDNQHFKKYAWIASIFYSLIQGLRWMRGADYYHYYNDLVTLFGQYSSELFGRGTITGDPDLLYDWWVHLFYYSGLPFWVAFVGYSAILIWGLLLILKKYPQAAVWALPMFFILTPSSENIIRQYIAEAVLLFATYFYLNGETKKMIAALCAIPLIHFSGVVVSLIFLIIVYMPRRTVRIFSMRATLWVFLILYIYASFFWDISALENVADWLSSSFHLDEEIKGANYLENADRWFTDEGSISKVLGEKAFGLSLINMTFRFLCFGSIIWFGFEAQRKDSRLLVFFLFSYFAILCKVMGGDIEMFGRFYNWFVILTPVLIGLFMSDLQIKRFKNLRVGIYIIYGLYFMWSSFLANIFSTSAFGYGFVWDR